MNILVTGGAGYIGSHAVLRLLENGHTVTAIDNFVRGNRGAISILENCGDFHFQEADLNDRPLLEKILSAQSIELVMHFAALAYVGESMEQPLRYYRNNAAGSLALLESMNAAGVNRMVFSSTCATYGEPPPNHIPIKETCPQQPMNPYGRSKLFTEHMLFDYAHRQRVEGKDFAFAALRYFNVAGSDRQGRLGEDHKPETHLIPICLEAALSQRDELTIYGTDYPTHDGTCVRDYVHVEDLIDAHVTTMNALKSNDTLTYNIGFGKGYSVQEVIEACRRVTGIDFKAVNGNRRPGDPPVLYADPSKIKSELNWTAQITDLDEIITSTWKWKQAHPNGYA